MAKKPNTKPAPKKIARRPAPKARVKPAAKRAEKPAIAEHRVTVASIAVHVRYGRDRSEEFELRGTALVNVGAPEDTVRTTGLVRLASRGGKSGSGLWYNPASLNRNLVLTLLVDPSDLALLREIFVTGTGTELSDPSLTVWATTARPLVPDAAGEVDVLEYGYSLDFDPAPAIGSR